MIQRKPATLPVLLVLGLAPACGGDDAAPLPDGCDAYLVPTGEVGGDQERVQEALVLAEPGQTLCFEGAFELEGELSLDQDGVTLRGVGEGATLDFAMQDAGGNGIGVQSVEGFVIEDLSVLNTSGDGVRVTSSTDVVFRRVKMIWERGPDELNGAYGLYPVSSTNVLIEDCEVSGASDAGIYVGQSTNIVVRRNLAWGNVAGIEIENSFDAEVYENEARDNTGGILVFDLPDLPAGQGGRVKVHHNTVTDNDQPSFASPGTIVSYVPAGTGVMILTMDEVEVHDNTITGNDSTGLLVLSFEIVEAVGAGGRPGPEFDPYPESIWVHDNVLSDNGAMPQGLTTEIGSPLEDILWDGVVGPDATGPALCIQDNGDATFRNFALNPEDFSFGTPSMDLAPHDCVGEALPPVELAL